MTVNRQIVLDTETTGLEPDRGHRIIEIGGVELIDRRLTGNRFHRYVNPEREIDDAALDVHGISLEFLSDKPVFADVVDDLLAYIAGSNLIIHNAPFDVGFIDYELGLLERRSRVADMCAVTDSLVIARHQHPGQRNSLDALCRRYGVDNSARQLHGALLDAEILAEVYLAMTGGQTLLFGTQQSSDPTQSVPANRLLTSPPDLLVVGADASELASHEAVLDRLEAVCESGAVWRRAAPA